MFIRALTAQLKLRPFKAIYEIASRHPLQWNNLNKSKH